MNTFLIILSNSHQSSCTLILRLLNVLNIGRQVHVVVNQVHKWEHRDKCFLQSNCLLVVRSGSRLPDQTNPSFEASDWFSIFFSKSLTSLLHLANYLFWYLTSSLVQMKNFSLPLLCREYSIYTYTKQNQNNIFIETFTFWYEFNA